MLLLSPPYVAILLHLDADHPHRGTGARNSPARLLRRARYHRGREHCHRNAPIADVNDISTTYFFVRQLGNTFGVTAATVLFDRRMTLHSSRLLDMSNRLDPTTRSTLAQYADLIHRNGGATSVPALGALQLFQNNVITQSSLFSYIDVTLRLGDARSDRPDLDSRHEKDPKLGSNTIFTRGRCESRERP